MKTIFLASFTFLLSLSMLGQTAVDLKFNLEKNKTYRVKTVAEQTSATTRNGMTINSETKSTAVLSIKPTSIGADFFTAEVRYDTLIMKINGMGMKMDINSSKKGNVKSTDPSEAMSAFTYRLSKNAIIAKIALNGNVIEIVNTKTLADSILVGIDSLQIGPMSALFQKQIKNMVSEKSLKNMIQNTIAYLPGKKVNVGDKWEIKSYSSQGNVDMLITNNYKLKKLNNAQAEISEESTMEPSPNAEPMQVNGAKLTYELNGQGKGLITIDTNTGWIVKGSVKMHMSGSMNVSAQGNEMQMPMEIDGTTEMTVIP